MSCAIPETLSIRNQYENWLFRHALKDLTGTETKALMYVVDRTLRWRKVREYISYDEFSGVGVGRRQAIRAVKALIEKGFIAVKSTFCKNEYTLVVDKGVESMSLKMPKAKTKNSNQGGDKTAPLQGCFTGEGGDKKDTAILTNLKSKDLTNSGGAVGADCSADSQLADVIERAKARSALAKSRKAARPADGLKALAEVWDSALREKYGHGHVFTSVAHSPKALGQLKLLRGKLSGVEDWSDFLSWCATRWYEVAAEHLSWATGSRRGAEPAMGLLLSFADVFARAYNDREAIDGGSAVALLRKEQLRYGQAPKKVATEPARTGATGRYQAQTGEVSEALAATRRQGWQGDWSGALESDIELPDVEPLPPFEE